MIGKFIDQILPEDTLPLTLTSYSPCSARRKARTVSRSAASTGFISSRNRK
ncbi:MAG: hypothetical protein V8T87_14405 [Victivallales bacterium]